MSQKKLAPVKVQKQSPTGDGWQFIVWVGEDDAKAEHTVILDREYWQKLTSGVGTPADLVKKSFEFLLKREPKESILKSFDLRIIRKYFPEYEKEITPEEPYLVAREKK